MKYQCNECIDQECCSKTCNPYYAFINKIADDLPLMTSDEIHEFRMTTPLYVKNKVEEFIKHNVRYSVPAIYERIGGIDLIKVVDENGNRFLAMG